MFAVSKPKSPIDILKVVIKYAGARPIWLYSDVGEFAISAPTASFLLVPDGFGFKSLSVPATDVSYFSGQLIGSGLYVHLNVPGMFGFPIPIMPRCKENMRIKIA